MPVRDAVPASSSRHIEVADRRAWVAAVLGAVVTFVVARSVLAGRGGILVLGALAVGGVAILLWPRAATYVLVTVGATVFSIPFHRVVVSGVQSDVAELIGFGLIATWVLRMALGLEKPVGPYVLPVVSVVAAAVVGSVYATLHGVSRAAIQGGIKPYLLYLLAPALSTAFPRERDRERLATGLLWVCTAASVIVVTQIATGQRVASESGTELFTLGRTFATSRYRPPLLTLLTLAVMIATGRALVRGWSTTRAVQLGLFVAVVLLGYNRSSWLPILLAAFLLALASRSPQRGLGVLRVVVVALVVGATLYGAMSLGAFGQAGRAIAARAASTANPAVLREQSYQDRAAENRDAWRAIRRSPVFGVGVAGLYGARRPFYRADLGRVVYIDRPYVHNAYLFLWLQLGIAGIIGVVWLAFRLIKSAALARVEQREAAVPALAAILATVAYGLAALFQPYNFNRPAILAIALCLVLGRVGGDSEPASASTEPAG